MCSKGTTLGPARGSSAGPSPSQGRRLTICGFAANGILISLPQTREIDTKKGPFLGEVSELISQGAAGDREISETLSQRSREGAAHRAGVS